LPSILYGATPAAPEILCAIIIPISLALKFGKIVVTTLAVLVASDVVGVAMCFFCEVFLSSRQTSTALYYAIWFVVGVFCGLISYMTSGGLVSPETKGDWTNLADAGKTGILVILTTAAVLTALSILFYRLTWRLPNLADSYYVPDSESLTLTFFVTILASVIFTHKTMRPEPAKKGAAGRRPG
jgi:hypothetical protein